MDTSRYHALCDRIGKLLNDYGKNHTVFDRTPAFQYPRPNGDSLGRNVASAMKRWDFRSLVKEGRSSR
jgi:hypothetical protein